MIRPRRENFPDLSLGGIQLALLLKAHRLPQKIGNV